MRAVDKNGSAAPGRILSIDVLRGLTIFLMLFVNDLYEPGVPHWLVHAQAHEDGMGLADIVFPAFLFMVGLSIPFAMASRWNKGETRAATLRHVLTRTLSLLLIGVFMVNAEMLSPQLIGMRVYVWALIVHVCFFLVWNRYPPAPRWRAPFIALTGLGWLGLLVMAVLYRSGTPAQVEWMHTSWWGILGLIGWGYAAAALTYLAIGDKLARVALVWLVFLLLNILALSHLTDALKPVRPIIGPLLDGNVPVLTLAGLLMGIVLRRHAHEPMRLLKLLLIAGLGCLAAGLVLRHWFILSKIMATPSWAMVCNGISVLAFTLVFYVVDVRRKTRWSRLFGYAGQHALTLYLAPDIVYYLIWLSVPHLLFYKLSPAPLVVIAGSLVWTLLMVGLVRALAILKIQLKL
jgi:predicted acyltransferase